MYQDSNHSVQGRHDARHQDIRIGMCPSGCVSFQFGFTTVHLATGDFQAFVDMLMRALPDIEIRQAHVRARHRERAQA